MIIIDHERYGMRAEFVDIEEANEAIRKCGGEFADATVHVSGDVVRDDCGEVVGSACRDIEGTQ